MPSYNNAARLYDNYPEYDDEYDQPSQPRRQPSQSLPAYRVAGQGGQLARQQPALPQPLPGGAPRRQPTGANVPVAPSRTYPQDYNRRVVAPAQPAPRRQVQAQGDLLSRLNFHPSSANKRLAVMGVGLVAVLVVSYLLVSFVVHTWQVWQDDMTYGRPRITRLEAAVGHNEVGGNKTLFLAQNLKGQISITEFPGGDPAKTRVIVGPHLFGKDTDMVPIKLQVKDMNGDGQPDLVATAEDQQLIYINENGNFRPINDQERAKLKALGNEDTK